MFVRADLASKNTLEHKSGQRTVARLEKNKSVWVIGYQPCYPVPQGVPALEQDMEFE